MIKLVYCVARRSDVEPDEFYRYWRQEHGELVKRHAEALKARRYVQSHTLDHPANAMVQSSKGTRDPYDGITELWWDSAEDLADALASEAGREADRALMDDERKFIDHSRSSVFFTEEHTIFDRR